MDRKTALIGIFGFLVNPYSVFSNEVETYKKNAKLISDFIISEAKKDSMYPGTYHAKNQNGWSAEREFRDLGYRVEVAGVCNDKDNANMIVINSFGKNNVYFTDSGLDGVCDVGEIYTNEGKINLKKPNFKAKYTINDEKIIGKERKKQNLIMQKAYGRVLEEIVQKYELK